MGTQFLGAGIERNNNTGTHFRPIAWYRRRGEPVGATPGQGIGRESDNTSSMRTTPHRYETRMMTRLYAFFPAMTCSFEFLSSCTHLHVVVAITGVCVGISHCDHSRRWWRAVLMGKARFSSFSIESFQQRIGPIRTKLWRAKNTKHRGGNRSICHYCSCLW